ncbi:MAG: hypothetical protein ACI9EW_001029 [Cellvibrionaceae bacterium]
MTFNFEKEPHRLLILLILGDLALIVIHILHSTHTINILSSPRFSISKDFGFAEVYGYAKEFWIMGTLFVFALEAKKKQLVYIAWSLLFLYLLLDDSIQIHEKLGEYLIDYFQLQPMYNLRAQDFGEIIVTLFFGLSLFSFIGVAYLFSDDTAKRVSQHLFVLILSLVFFGVIVDIAHEAIAWGKEFWRVVEDGGELIILSIIVWYVLKLKIGSQEQIPLVDSKG